MQQLAQKLKDGRMQITEVPVPDLRQGVILVCNFYSLISVGTEGSTVRTARKGYIGKAKERPEQVKQVVDTLRSQGTVQTYRAVMKKLDSYSPLGYSCVGTVVQAPSSKLKAERTECGDGWMDGGVEGRYQRSEVGGRKSEFRVGDVVACGGSTACHAEVVAVPRNLCVKVPQSAERRAQGEKGIGYSEEHLRMAAYNTLGAIALQGVRQADLRLGESCVVIGMGLLGQLSAVLLKASGVRVIGIDIDSAAVELGREHCLDLGIERNDPGIVSKVSEFTGGIGCDGVIITAASSSLDPINFAGEISRKRGTVVVVGAVPTGFERDPHFYKKELTVKMSCSYGPGRYDPEYEEKGRDYPVGYVRWTEKRNMQAFQSLIAEGKIDIGYLTTHVFKLEEARKAYDMIVEKSEPYLGILIKYDPQITQINADSFVSRKDAKAQRDEDLHPSGIRSDKLNATRRDSVNLTRQAVTSEFHGAGITPVPFSEATGQAQTKIIVKPSSISYQPSAISIGFIGAGSYAQSYLLPNIPKGKDVVLRGVMTSTSTGSRSVADRYGFEFCTGNADDILGDEGINTVFIATRHDSHGHYVKKALEAGKDVFVEKPLCLNLEELVEIQAAHGSWLMADSKDEDPEQNKAGHQLPITNNESQITSNVLPLLMVGYNRRFSPLTRIIKERMDQGPFSMLYRVNAGMIPADSWIQDVEVGGGRILGEVCHFVDFLMYVNGSLPVSVFASSMADANHHNDTLTVSLRYQNGSVGSIQYFANGSKSLPKEYVEIYAHGVTAVLNDYRELRIFGKGKPYKKKLMSQDKGQKNEVRLFLDAVKNGDVCPIPLEEIWSASEVCFGILESIRTGQSIKLSAPQ